MYAITSLIVAALAATAAAAPAPGKEPAVNIQKGVSPAKPVTPIDPNSVPALITKLKGAPTNVDRFSALLLDDSKNLLQGEDLRTRTIFDYNVGNVPAKGATGGAISLANIKTFPILADQGIAVAMGFLGACGLNTPHTHPRASEYLTVVEGEIESGFILENGFVDANGKPFEVRTSLGKNQGTLFPMGSNHWQFNPTCKNATFVAALSNEDPGVSQIAQNFFNIEGDVIEATLGFPESIDGKDIMDFAHMIPANVAQIVKDCVNTCHGKKY